MLTHTVVAVALPRLEDAQQLVMLLSVMHLLLLMTITRGGWDWWSSVRS
jgi:hypothetical protein